MSSESVLRIAALCVLLASAETIHGIVRTMLVTPRIGKELAIKLSAFTGTLLAFTVCWFVVPSIGLQSSHGHIALGLGLASFMATFDIAIGRLLLRKSWAKIWPDFNPSTGNYLAYGLLALCFIPLLVWLATGSAPRAAA